MSDKNTTQVALEIHRTESSTTIVKQYGMRYPDGTVKWGDEDRDGYGGVNFKRLAERDPNHEHSWNSRLKERAAKANLELSYYTEQHQPVTRQVVVAILDIEEA
jgi:hypothetical protein